MIHFNFDSLARMSSKVNRSVRCGKKKETLMKIGEGTLKNCGYHIPSKILARWLTLGYQLQRLLRCDNHLRV